MSSQSEYYLESLITDACKGKGFQKINELFEDNPNCPQQHYGKMLLNQLDKLINKELDRNEFEHVRLLLKCIQHFCRSKCQESWSLIQQGLVSKALEFLKICKDINSSIPALVEDFFGTILDICRCGSEEGVKAVQDSFLLTLGYVIMEKWPHVNVRLEALKALNFIINNVPRDEKKKFCASEEICALMQNMARKLLEVGDYDLQVAITEALCRMATKKLRDYLAPRWFEDSCIAKAFQEINDKDFETDSRKFLNYLNSRLQDRRVYTFPCSHIYTDVKELVQPQDEYLEYFWIDFNVVTDCVSFYVQNTEGCLWDSVRLYKEMLSGYSLQEANGLQILNIYLESPLTVSSMEIKHLKIHFEPFLDIYTGLVKTYGRELQIVSSVQNDNLKQVTSAPVGTSTVKAMSATPKRRKRNQSSLNKSADTSSDVLNSLDDYQSAAKLNFASPKEITAVNDSQDVLQDSFEAPVPTTEENTSAYDPNDTTRVVSSAEQDRPPELSAKVLTASDSDTKGQSPNKLLIASAREPKGESPNNPAAQKSEFDFADSPKSVPDIKMTLAKEMSSSNWKSGYTQRRTRAQDSNKKAVNYRECDSSESDEAASTIQSGKNWSIENKRKSTTPSADYSRKKQKSKSKLKVLPLCFGSSSDEEKRAKKSAHTKTKNEWGKAESLAFSELPGVSGLLTPRDSAKQGSSGAIAVFAVDDLQEISSEAQHLVKSTGKPLKSYAARTATQGNEDMTAALPKEPHASVEKKRKLSDDEDHGDFTFKPRKLFSSFEETKASEELEDDVFQSESHASDIAASSFISSFGSFSGDFKNKMMSRYKELGARAQNVLSTSHLQVFNLINQIQQVNFQKLNRVNKIIAQEISSFEMDTQALKDLEKETLDFWEAETLKINTFCANQKQRIEEIDLALNETVCIHSENEDQITDV